VEWVERSLGGNNGEGGPWGNNVDSGDFSQEGGNNHEQGGSGSDRFVTQQ
jgi:hypothetical protein